MLSAALVPRDGPLKAVASPLALKRREVTIFRTFGFSTKQWPHNRCAQGARQCVPSPDQNSFIISIFSLIYLPDTTDESGHLEPNINQSNELEEDISSIEKGSQPREGESEELLPIPNDASKQVFKIIYQINVKIDGNEQATKKLGKSLHEIININDMLEKTLDKVTEVEFHIQEVLDSGHFKPEDLRDTMKRIDILVAELKTMGKIYARSPSKGQQYSGGVKPNTIAGKPGKGTDLSVREGQKSKVLSIRLSITSCPIITKELLRPPVTTR